MENEEINTEEPSKLDEESALLKAYKNLQETTVSKEQYNKEVTELKEKNAMYLKAITEGAQVDTPSEKEYDIPAHIAKVNKFKGTNLDYWKQMTELTDNILKSTPNEQIIKIAGSEGLDEIIKVNEGMKQMVKDSNNDPDLFRSLFNARVVDSAPNISAGINKAGGLVNYLQQNSKK